jgi:hypothetical protein
VRLAAAELVFIEDLAIGRVQLLELRLQLRPLLLFNKVKW